MRLRNFNPIVIPADELVVIPRQKRRRGRFICVDENQFFTLLNSLSPFEIGIFMKIAVRMDYKNRVFFRSLQDFAKELGISKQKLMEHLKTKGFYAKGEIRGILVVNPYLASRVGVKELPELFEYWSSLKGEGVC